MAARQRSTGKRLRFEVFKRDAFTCQYCGAQPPGVVLVPDHITPYSSGGATSLDNLITACEPCNQGKAGKSLTRRTIRPDADLLYLETQQEIAELQRYQVAKIARDAQITKVIVLLQQTWVDVSGLDWHPADHVMHRLLAHYSPDVAEEALVDVAAKVGTGYISPYGNSQKWVAYLFRVANTLEESQEDAG